MRAKELLENSEFAPQPFYPLEEDTRFDEELILDIGNKFADYIHKNCQPWLNAVNNNPEPPVYRGFMNVKYKDSSLAAGFIKSVRQDRRPRDSGPERHELYNELIRLCNKTANRTNSIFVTGVKSHALQFGRTFVTIPIGNFNYTWHENFEDWTGQRNKIERKVLYKANELPLDNRTIANIKSSLAKEQRALDFLLSVIHKHDQSITKDDLEHAILNTWMTGYVHFPDQWLKYKDTSYKDIKHANENPYDLTFTLLMGTAHKESTPEATRKQIINTMQTLHKEYKDRHSYGVSAEDAESQYERAIIRAQYNIYNSIPYLERIDPKRVAKDFCPSLLGDDNTMLNAIESGKEIMIKCDNMLAIHPVLYRRVISLLLSGVDPEIDTQLMNLLHDTFFSSF